MHFCELFTSWVWLDVYAYVFDDFNNYDVLLVHIRGLFTIWCWFCVCKVRYVHLIRLPYMNDHVLLNLLNELRKRGKMRGLPSILSRFLNEFIVE